MTSWGCHLSKLAFVYNFTLVGKLWWTLIGDILQFSTLIFVLLSYLGLLFIIDFFYLSLITLCHWSKKVPFFPFWLATNGFFSQTCRRAAYHYVNKRTKHGVRSLTKEPHKPTPNLDIKSNKCALYNNRSMKTTYIIDRMVNLPPA